MTASDKSNLVGYFGFGSLVNRDTLRTDFIDHIPASLHGWRRHWQTRSKTAERFGNSPTELVLLSIHEDRTCILDGAIVIDHISNLAAVDEREAGYSRVRLDRSVLDVPGDIELPGDIYVYVAHPVDPSEDGKGALLQSYLDAVMQGYLLSFGEEGVSKFIDTTVGFNRSIVTDRTVPVYPRSVELSVTEALLFDRELVRAGVRFS